MRIPQKPKEMKKIFIESKKDLFKLLDDDEIRDFVNKCNDEYVHWDKLRYKKIPKDENPEHVWALLKFFRMSRYECLKFDGWKFLFSLIPNFHEKLHLLDLYTAGNIQCELDSINSAEKDRFVISSLMEEAIASSQLEGAATTRTIAKMMLKQKKKPRNYSEKMIVNGYRNMQSIQKLKNQNITPEMILNLHRSITKDTLKDKRDEGRFRDNNDIRVMDAFDREKVYHTPPDYKKIVELIKDFCEFANNDTNEFIHPVIKGIILHFLIGYIHPFNDGNGRTARTIFYWYMLKRGYWLFEYMTISRVLLRSKVNYGLAYLYSETDENDLTYFIKYNLKAIDEALIEMREHLKRKQEEQRDAKRMIEKLGRNRKINLRQGEVLWEITKNPEKSFTINEIMTTYGVVYQTARTDLLYLTMLGYLRKQQLGRQYIFRLAKKPID